MQTTLPMVFLPGLPVDRMRDIPAVKPAAGASGADLNAGGGAADQDAARAEEMVRQAQARRGDTAGLLGVPPLDTREVGDFDIIDPERPTARIPDPIVSLDEAREGRAEPVPVPDPLPAAEDDPETGREAAVAAPEAAAQDSGPPPLLKAEGPAGAGRNAAPAAPDTADRPAPDPRGPAGPPSPRARAADVPDPPPPGTFDLRR